MMRMKFVPPGIYGCADTMEADYYPCSKIRDADSGGQIIDVGTKVHCQIYCTQTIHIHYFAHNVTVVGESEHGDMPPESVPQNPMLKKLPQDPVLQNYIEDRQQILHDPNLFKVSTQYLRRGPEGRGQTKGTNPVVHNRSRHTTTSMPSLAIVDGITRRVVRALPFVIWNHSTREIRLLMSLSNRRELHLKYFYARVTVESIVLQYLHIDESGEEEEYTLSETPELAFKWQCVIPGATEVRLLGPLTIEIRLRKAEKVDPTAMAYPFKTKHLGWLQPDILQVGKSDLEDRSGSERTEAEYRKEFSGAECRINSAALATHPDISFTSPAESSDDDSEDHGAFWF